jgi:DNA-binding transcriptional MerR regulator
MESSQNKLLTVGELARKGGVTVRTLQYYDAKGLLVPSEYSEGGRRMYSRRDIIRLQQIVFLKSMGFSLEEIRDRMLPAESSAELEQMFRKQKDILLEQIAQIQETVNDMDKIIDEIKQGSEIDIDRLLIIVGAIRKGNPYSFMFRYISKNQMEYIFNCIENEEAAGELNKSLKEFSAELIEICRQNEKPEGLKGQEMAGRWWSLMMTLTKGDTSFIHDFTEVVKNQRNWPSGIKEFNENTMLFLRRAIITYLKNKNIKL